MMFRRFFVARFVAAQVLVSKRKFIKIPVFSQYGFL
jgi:hypothetical protein